MRSLLILAVAACLLTMVACENDSSLTEPQALEVATLDGFENGPAIPGNSGVFRLEGVLITASTDPARDLIAYHLFADDFVGCGGGSGVPLANVQIVDNSNGNGTAWRVVGKYGNIPILVYRLSDLPVPGTPEWCDFLANDWLYRGFHTLNYNDNDYTLGGPGGNSFSWKGHGNVLDPDGNTYRYTENQHALWDYDTMTQNYLTENIKIHPIGN